MRSKKVKPVVHFAPQYFIDSPHPITIALIGCGGTGSLILPRLARLDYALRQFGRAGLMVTVYDGDKVEEHNQGRQNFVESDVAKFKAAVLVEKVNVAFGLQWECVNKYVKPDKKMPLANIIITCVDNALFRMEMHRCLQKRGSGFERDFKKLYYWMDAGNGKDFGQVVLSTVDHIDQPDNKKYTTVDFLPSVVDRYGDLVEHDNKKTQGMDSCSFVESIMQQDLFINDAIAVQACQLLWRLLKDYNIGMPGVIINQAAGQQRPLSLKR